MPVRHGHRSCGSSKVHAGQRGWYLEQTFVRRGAVVARAVVQARFLRRSGGTVPMTDLLDAVGGAPADRDLPEWVHGWAGAVRISSTA
ncbi:hypothetical protein EDF63_0874 [Curtobacterium sp. JUb34]|uniref:hypothetical protein n=1 Tax=Curtobacterium sp. JUb34 TaxID=2485109 RepID=UPI000FAA59BB|nr:hypothetical protein [Curtobacterium sp. JUb34]ROR36742.1 hypothetical protein EDF63_0874 [Curtobacterium sp. JUb34]